MKRRKFYYYQANIVAPNMPFKIVKFGYCSCIGDLETAKESFRKSYILFFNQVPQFSDFISVPRGTYNTICCTIDLSK